MTEKLIRVLSSDRYGGFIRWLQGNGEAHDEAGREASFIAYFDYPGIGIIEAHAKLYGDRQHKGVANEITGYLAANRLGLKQPEPAFLCEIPLAKIDLKTLPKQHAWLKKIKRERGTYYAWCTRTENYPTPWHHFGSSMASAIRDDLINWPDVHRAMTMDDIVANIDRNLKNLLRISKGTYALIDHGSLVTERGDWHAEQLDENGRFRNKLLEMLYEKRPADAANTMIAEAEQAAAILTAIHELKFWWERLLDTQDMKAFDNFIQKRTISAPERLAERYCLC